jgi:2-polyprenyl-6-methoxyphenol hydroxylase-like FAD-dependent oxidoreductase
MVIVAGAEEAASVIDESAKGANGTGRYEDCTAVDVIIVGAGIGGLTLALMLHRAGIPAHVFEAATELRPLGAGINILPHASAQLCELGLESALTRVAVETMEAAFYNRFGQLIYREPLGRRAGYASPQFSLHRGDLQRVLLEACSQRLGSDRVHMGWKCARFTQNSRGVTVHFIDAATGDARPKRADVAVGCDGLHSAVRRQLHPHEGEPRYSGVNMWRGVTPWEPFLTGASMVRAGWLTHGKMVIYPIRNNIDAGGRQLVNWVAEIETPRHRPKRDWNRPGKLADFIDAYADWHFNWLDVPAMIRATEPILEFPMIDQDPLPWWTQGRVTLLGDAAHPMLPRGSNGAGQAVLDARALADALAGHRDDPAAALQAYEAKRLPATTSVVLTNRENPPDAIIREVYLRTGDKPFARIEDVISDDELRAISDSYKRVAQYDHESLRR